MAKIKQIESIFISKFKGFLKRENITQKDLAEGLYMHSSTLNKKMYNKSGQLNLDEVQAISKILRLDEQETFLFVDDFASHMLDFKINKYISKPRTKRKYYEEMFHSNNFQKDDQKNQLFEFFNSTPLFDLELINIGLFSIDELKNKKEECFFPEPVDYCLKINYKSQLLFSTVPERCIVGINALEGISNIEKIYFAITTLEEYKDTLFYFRTKLDEYHKEYYIAYITVNNEKEIIAEYSDGIPLDIAERYSKKHCYRRIKAYPHGREYKEQSYEFPEIELLGYVKGLYKSEFTKFIDWDY